MPEFASSRGETTHWCNTCFRETSHDICARDVLTPDRAGIAWTSKTVMAVRCRGCRNWSIRREADFDFFVDDSDSDPPRLWRKPPEWLSTLESVAPDLASLLDEVYMAANDRQSRLLSMGVRAALDHVMVQIVGDAGSFEQKLEQMAKHGHLSSRQRDMLATVIDAGSAAIHRGYRPPEDLLQQMLAVMEGIIRDHYVTGPMLESMKRQIPPKPPRRS